MKSLLSRLMSKKDSEIREVVQSIDASGASRGLRRRFEKIRAKQGGFTLLELLVVVSILAVLAGTATMLLEDLDRKASAAAHVNTMNELVSGIDAFRKLNGGAFPNRWDSLLQSATGALTAGGVPVASDTDFGLDGDLAAQLATIDVTGVDAGGGTGQAISNALAAVGITEFMTVGLVAGNDPNGAAAGGCGSLADIRTMIADKSNDITNSAIFSAYQATVGDAGNRGGCGVQTTWTDPDGDGNVVTAATSNLARLEAAENYRVGAGTTDVLVALGFGASNSLFTRGGEDRALSMTAPFYRHVDGYTYNRYVALFNVGPAATPFGEARLQAIVDGSGDTKEEELGEWDGSRSTL